MQSSRQSSQRVGEVTAPKRPLGASFLLLIPAFVTFALFLAQPTPGFAQDSSSWMAQDQQLIQTVPLKGIAMPGTHDTFSYVSAPYLYFGTQDLDITGQLNAGVRHFDMRTLILDSNGNSTNGKPCAKAPSALPFSGAGYYMYIHGFFCTGVKLSDALDQISSFLDAHPQEIILLYFTGFVSTGSPTYESSAAFEAVLDQHLRAPNGASYIYDAATACKLAGQPWTPYPPGVYAPDAQYSGFCSLQGPTSQGVTSQGVPPQEVTPQQLYTTSARVILVEKFGLTGTGLFPNDSARLTWSDGTTDHIGPVENNRGYYEAGLDGASDPGLLDNWLEYNTPDGNLGLYGTRPVGAGYESDPQILTLQANLTPGGNCSSNCSYFILGVQALATVENPHLDSDILSPWTTYSVNVVQVDFADLAINLPSCLLSNVFNPTPPPCVTIVRDILNFNNQTFGRVPFGFAGTSRISVGHDGSVYKLGLTDGSGSGPLGQNHQLFKLTGNTGQIGDWTPINFGGNRIAADPSGGVWILDATGTHLTNLNKNGTLSTIPLPPGPPLGPLLDIAVDNTGALYAIATFSAGSFSSTQPIKYSNGQWESIVFPAAPTAARIAANNSVIAVLDTNGNIEEGSGNGTWVSLNPPFTATSVAVDDRGTVWATQAEEAVGAYPGYSPVPRSGLWSKQPGVAWVQSRTDGVQVAAGSSPEKDLDVVYVIDNVGNAHNLLYNNQ
jgi:hypothetical protein